MRLSKYPFVSIIILNWNGSKLTTECISSLFNDHYKKKEIIVVDNGSTDDSVRIIKTRFPNIEIIENKKNYGYAKGNNIGIKKCLSRKSELILILNNDTIIKNNILLPLIKQIKNSKKIGIVCPKIFDLNNRINSFGARIDFDAGDCPGIGSGEKDSIKFSKRKFVDAAAGSCMLIRTEVFRKIGLIPEDYFLYYEETDFSLKARRAGFNIVVEPKASIIHRVGGSTNPNTSTLYRYYITRNRFLFMKRFAPTFKWWKFFIKNSLKNLYLIIKLLISTSSQNSAKTRNAWAKAYFFAYLDFIRNKIGRAQYPWLTTK